MITITQDSELMTNLIPANPIPAGNRFVAFKDDNFNPAVFSLGDDGSLNLVMTVHGEPTLTDFGDNSHLFSKGTKFQAFDVKQAPDLGLNICVATEASNGQSDFHLIHAIKPSELLHPVEADKVVRGNGFSKIHHIFMSNFYTSKIDSMPLIFVAFKPPERIFSDDLGYVTFVQRGEGGYTASLNSSWGLATNPVKIIDVDFGTNVLGNGAFVLYQGVSTTKLQFIRFKDQGKPFTVEPQCPENATCLASFLDPHTKSSTLLVGGDKIGVFQPKDYVSHQGQATFITTKESIKDIHVSTLGDALRVWYTTKANGASYYTTKISALTEGRFVPLLADGQGGQISGLLSLKPVTGNSEMPVSSLVSVDENKALLLLQQDPKSGIWQQFPFYHVSTTNVIKVQGYTLRLQAKALNDSSDSKYTPDRTLIPGCWLRVSSSGVIRCIINGRTTSLAPTGQWLQTNAQGVLNIIFATQDATCYKVRADAFRPANTPEDSSTVRLLDVPLLDPTRKLLPKLKSINSPQDLRSAKTQSGEPLISTDASEKDVQKSVTAIQLLREQMKYFNEKDEKSYQAFKSKATSPGQSAVDNGGSSIGNWLDDIYHGIGDAFNWLWEKAGDAYNWVVEKIEHAWGTVVRLVIQIAGETYEIILDSVSTIVQAVSWVFKKLGVLFQKLIDFLGFLFSWDDILDTADSMVTMLNAGLDYGEQQLTQTETDVKNWLQNLKKTVKDQLPMLSKHDFKDTSLTRDDQLRSPQIGSTEQEHQESVEGGVGCNWASYQLQYGGSFTNGTMKSSSTKNSSTDKVNALWHDVQDELKTIPKYLVDMLDDFKKPFKDGKFDANILISKILADTIDMVVDSLTTLSDILFKAAELGISMVRALCTYEVDVPVFTWLWKLIVPGRPFNLANFVSLLVAIPSTVLYKAVKGKAPPKLKGRVTKQTFQEYIEKGSVSQDKDLASDISSFNNCAAVGIGTTLCAVTTATLVVGGVFETAGLETYSMELQTQKLHSQNKAVEFQPYLQLPNWAGNLIDSLSLILETAVAVRSWPLWNEVSKHTTGIQFCYWGAWVLELSNAAAIVVTRAVGLYTGLKRVETKRWRGWVAAVTSVPIFVMQLVVHIAVADTSNATTRHILESVAELGSQWGFTAAAFNDEIDDEIMWIGLAIYITLTVNEIAISILDFVYG